MAIRGCTVWMRKIAFAGLPIFGLALSFAAFDWLMGLNYRWFSTMWGPYIFAGAAGSSMSLLVLVVTALRQAGYLKVVTLEHYHIMGNGCWPSPSSGPTSGFSQYMLYWYAPTSRKKRSIIMVRNTESWWLLKHAPGRRALLWSVLNSAASGNQRTTTSTLHRRRLDRILCRRSICTIIVAPITPRHRRSPQRLGFPLPNRHRFAASPSFICD